MLKRVRLLIALTLLLLPIAGAQADSMDGDVFCGDLQASDCQILLDNAAVMDEIFSAAFSMSMDMQASGDAPEDNMRLSGAGSGSLAVDPTLLADILAAQAEPDGDSIGALIELALTAMSGEFMLDLNIDSSAEPLAMTLSLRLKDGVIAFNAGAMEEFTGESMEGFEWFGVDVSGALDDVLMQAGMDSLPGVADPSAMEKEVAHALAVTRLADDVVAGIPVAVFETRIDAGSVASLYMGEALEAAGSEQGELISRHYIGLADHFTRRMTIAGDMALPKSEAGEIAGNVNLAMNIGIDMSAFNQPVSVEIPEDAMVFPLAMMMQMGER